MPGSHRITWQLRQRAGGFMRTSEMKSVLAGEHAWFGGLWREPIRDNDVVLMNQRVLHVAAPNTLTAPRMMLSDFIT